MVDIEDNIPHIGLMGVLGKVGADFNAKVRPKTLRDDDVVGGGCYDDVYDDDAHLLSNFFRVFDSVCPIGLSC